MPEETYFRALGSRLAKAADRFNVSEHLLGSIMNSTQYYLFIGGFKRDMQAPGVSTYSKVVSAGLLTSDDKTVSAGAAKAITDLKDVLNKNSFFVVASAAEVESGLAGQLADMGIQVIVSDDKADLERQLESRTGSKIYTLAVGEAKNTDLTSIEYRMTKSILESHKKNVTNAKVVVVNYSILSKLQKDGKDYLTLYLPREAYNTFKELRAATFVGNKDDFRSAFREMAIQYSDFVRFLLAPWEALKNLYLSLRTVEVAA